MNPVTATGAGVDFSDIRVETPDIDALAREYRRFKDDWESAADAAGRRAVFDAWDARRRAIASWESLTRLRFDQNTKDVERKSAREQLDELAPKLTALDVEMQRMLLSSPHRGELEGALGPHLFALWEADVKAFAPAIEDDLTRESQLEARYTELLAGATFEIAGTSVTLEGLTAFRQNPDRAERHRAERLRNDFFAANAADLDRIYDELVRLRTAMARTLGFDDFIGLGYKRMYRIDFDRADVERYRDEVRRHIVPLAADVIANRARALGLADMSFWDEPMISPAGNPAPHGDHDWILAQGRRAFEQVHPEVGDFYRMMVERSLLDLRNRQGKAGGGYCTAFPDYGVPYIFANFNGTHGDVHVLVHEMGHAFQDWKSRTLPAYDYLSPTSESAEIHSMGMEYLAAPYAEQFFGPDAERFRRQQLEDALLFLPYGVAIDHFQHLVYAAPGASPAERHAMWQQMEARYLPWRRYGDLGYWAKGGLWQAKGHLYHVPFYYIDYTLALCCALQFWARSRRDHAAAVADYIALCARGGEAPFGELVRSANLRSPFEEGVLAQVAAEARTALTA